jgi:hypothetical protein
MTGKSVPKDIGTYINGVSLKKDAQRVSNVLRMEPTAPQTTAKTEQILDTVLEVLKELVKDRLAEKGLAKVKPTDWQRVYEKLLPEHKRKEKVDFS